MCVQVAREVGAGAVVLTSAKTNHGIQDHGNTNACGTWVYNPCTYNQPGGTDLHKEVCKCLVFLQSKGNDSLRPVLVMPMCFNDAFHTPLAL